MCFVDEGRHTTHYCCKGLQTNGYVRKGLLICRRAVHLHEMVPLVIAIK